MAAAGMAGAGIAGAEIAGPAGLPRRVWVDVPATSANLGAGFDSLGLALEMRNEFELELLGDPRGLKEAAEGAGAGFGSRPAEASGTGEGNSPLEVLVSGDDGELPTDRSNLVYRAACEVWCRMGLQAPALRIRIWNRVPLGRGLGSSATAVVAGLVGANALIGGRLSPAQLLEAATALEGHPDNVAAALLGGLVVAVREAGSPEPVRAVPLPVGPEVRAVVAWPGFQVSTSASRRALPEMVSRGDAVFNLGRAALTVAAICSRRYAELGEAMRDRLHQPARAAAIPGLTRVFEAATSAGAWGVALSGSGPAVLALTPVEAAEAVARSMVEAFAAAGLNSRSRILEVAREGARVRLE